MVSAQFTKSATSVSPQDIQYTSLCITPLFIIFYVAIVGKVRAYTIYSCHSILIYVGNQIYRH